METWWSALNTLEKIYFCMAISGTLILIVQIVLMLFGIGSDAIDVDLNGDGLPDVSLDVSDGLNLFTLRGIVSFFAIGGWVGYTLAGSNPTLAIILSIIAGTLALVLMALAVKGMMKMRSNGVISLNKANGMMADVYLTIPAKGAGVGKVNLILEERYVELNAIQEGEDAIPSGARVKVIGISGDLLVVEKL